MWRSWEHQDSGISLLPSPLLQSSSSPWCIPSYLPPYPSLSFPGSLFRMAYRQYNPVDMKWEKSCTWQGHRGHWWKPDGIPNVCCSAFVVPFLMIPPTLKHWFLLSILVVLGNSSRVSDLMHPFSHCCSYAFPLIHLPPFHSSVE